MKNLTLSFNSRKALCVNIGEPAGKEVANLIEELAERIGQLELSEQSGPRIVPARGAELLCESTLNKAA